jgi:lipoprotein NlpI
MPKSLRFTEKITPTFHYISFAGIFIAMAVLLREAVPFYGDGYFFQKDIISNLPIKYAEVLTMLIYRAVYIALPESARTGATAYQLVNTICVIPAVIILVLFARRSKRNYLPFLLLTFFGFGSNVLFFGHVENYTLCFVTILAYLYTVTRPKPNIPVLGFLLGLSICLHLIALCLIPSFMYVLWRTRAKTPIGRILLFSAASFTVPFFVTLLFSFVAGMTPVQLYAEVMASITTLSEHTARGYFSSLFSIHRWLDVINLLFLGLPTFLIIAVLIFGHKKNEKIWHNQSIQLLLMLGVPFILFVLFFNTPLGLARDWDLGVTALIWRVAAVVYVAQYIAPKIRIRSGLLTSIGLLTFFLSLPWLVIHHLPQYGVKRYKDLCEAKSELPGTAYGYEILGRYYHDIEDYPNSLKNYELAARYDPQNWRRHYSVAMENFNIRDFHAGIKNLQKAYELNPHEHMILTELGMAYSNVGQNDSALNMFQQLYQLDPTDIANRHNLGCAYYWTGQYDSARAVFESALEDHPDHYNVTFGLIDVLIATEDLEQAEDLLKRLESRYGRDRTIQQYWQTLRNLKQK